MKYDVIVIGSGFGGAMAAHVLVQTGARVLMLERGEWLPRGPENRAPDGCWVRSPAWHRDTPYIVRGECGAESAGAFHCVGGPSVMYGGASLRFREADFEPAPEIADGSGAAWPFGYDELEPWYGYAEHLLGVCGMSGKDPTEPWRSQPWPEPSPELSPTSLRIEAAARRLGLHPSPLPLAIDFHGRRSCRACTQCGTCDAFACSIGAKNDIASAVLPSLIDAGLSLRTGVVATRLLRRSGRIVAVECSDTTGSGLFPVETDHVVLAAGALASPQLVLSSGLQHANPGGCNVGRWLMRHCNYVIQGLFREPPGPRDTFHKQLCIHDYYFGHPDVRHPSGKLGSLQQMHGPPIGFLETLVPRPVHKLLPPLLHRMTALLAMAEDQPRADNAVTLHPRAIDRFGRPRAVVTHRSSPRDRHARRVLSKVAARILREAGAVATIRLPIRSFSHALGTLRLGDDPARSVLDSACRFRGIENLTITDASVFPTSAAVNPSLTIAALALRAADQLVGGSFRLHAAGSLSRVRTRARFEHDDSAAAVQSTEVSHA